MIIKTHKGNEWTFTVTGVDILPIDGMKINGIRKTNEGSYEEISVLINLVELAAVANALIDSKDKIIEECRKL